MYKVFTNGVLIVLLLVINIESFVIKSHFKRDLTNIISKDGYPCTSKIYCQGPLLETVQMAKIFKDSKTFVDMKLKQSPDITLELFDTFMKEHNQNPTKDEIHQFVLDNFEKEGSEFESWRPDDWKERPKFIDAIQDSDFRQWASDLNHIWSSLGRKMVPSVMQNEELYSIIAVPNPVIVPGGRFREFYYWDTLWIVKGLIHCEMYTTVRGMIENFLSIVDRLGYIPNGGRIYYAARSQPPLLASMIKLYVDVTGDVEFAKNSVDTLAREFEFFRNNRTHIVNGFQLAAYGSAMDASGPRPESFSEDYETASKLPNSTLEARQALYAELQAGAESGQDFTSRWFISPNGTNEGSLVDIKTRSIIPVELNVILCENARIISQYYSLAGNSQKAGEYAGKAIEIQDAIQGVLWNEEQGTWLDYDLLNKQPRMYFTASNLSPLWYKTFNPSLEQHITDRILDYINRTGIDAFVGGVPNTLLAVNEQWDFPNVWPPMQHMLIEGLEGLHDPRAKQLAFKWAERWIRSNFVAYRRTQNMYEKYHADEVGGTGHGGEYEVQEGFGWTNGVIMDLLAKYGNIVTVSGAN